MGIQQDSGVWSALALLRTRWYAAVAVVVVTLAIAAFVALRMGPEFEVHASALAQAAPPRVEGGLVQPRQISRWEPRTLIPVLSRRLSGANEKQTLLSAGLSDRYAISVDRDAGLLDVTVTASTRKSAIDTTVALLADAARIAAELQAADNVPLSELVSMETVDLDTNPLPRWGSKLRVMAAIGLLGGLGALLLSSALQGLAARRAARNAPETEQAAQQEPNLAQVLRAPSGGTPARPHRRGTR